MACPRITKATNSLSIIKGTGITKHSNQSFFNNKNSSEDNLNFRPYGGIPQPNGRIPQPNGRISQPNGRISQPYGRTSQPYGRTSRPYGRTSRPYGRTLRPYGGTFRPYGGKDILHDNNVLFTHIINNKSIN